MTHVAELRPTPPDQEDTAPIHQDSISHLTTAWLRAIGEQPGREGLLKTPERVGKAWTFLTRGYEQDLQDIVHGAVFSAEAAEMVVVRNIEFYSMCEHHMLPFFGQAHIAYLPTTEILGLSKFARIVDMFAARLQVQERLTTQIAQAIQDLLNPAGVAVLLEGTHLCMSMRGIKKQHSTTMTTSVHGVFQNDPARRQEFMQAVHR